MVGSPVEGSLQVLTMHTWAVGVATGVGVKVGQLFVHSHGMGVPCAFSGTTHAGLPPAL